MTSDLLVVVHTSLCIHQSKSLGHTVRYLYDARIRQTSIGHTIRCSIDARIRPTSIVQTPRCPYDACIRHMGTKQTLRCLFNTRMRRTGTGRSARCPYDAAVRQTGTEPANHEPDSAFEPRGKPPRDAGRVGDRRTDDRRPGSAPHHLGQLIGRVDTPLAQHRHIGERVDHLPK